MNPNNQIPGSQVDPSTIPNGVDVARAAVTFETAQARLFRSDGQPVYGEAEHESRKQDLLASFDAVVIPLIDTLTGHAADAERALTAVQRDPVMALDTADAARAGALQPFLKEDFETLPLVDLVDRLKAVLARGARPEMALAHRYAQRRIAAERAAHPLVVGSGEHAALDTSPHPEAAILRALGDGYSELDGLLAPKDLAMKTATVNRTRTELHSLRRYASNTRDRISGEADRRMDQMRARIGAAL